jgi:hypothetical protein
MEEEEGEEGEVEEGRHTWRRAGWGGEWRGDGRNEGRGDGRGVWKEEGRGGSKVWTVQM